MRTRNATAPARAIIATPFPAAVIGRVRADTPNPAAMVAQIQAGWNEHRTAVEDRLSRMEAAIDTNATRAAADRLGSPNSGPSVLGHEVAANFTETLRGRPAAAMTSQSDPDGGFTVPTQVDGIILSLLRSISPMRQLATLATLGPAGNSWTKIVNRIGSGTAWAGEEETRSDTDSPKLGAVEIPVSEIYAIPALTNEILEDSSFNLNAFLQEDVATEFALGEGGAFINGDGVKKPLGILAKATSDKKDAERPFGIYQHIVTGADGDFSANAQDDLIDLITKLPAVYRREPSVAWLMNSVTSARLQKLKDADGRSLWRAGLADGEPSRLLGYPVAIDEGMPDIATGKCSIAFGAWKRGYAIVDRRGIRVIVDRLTQKGWTKIYFSKRVGGAPLDTNAIKFLKFSAT